MNSALRRTSKTHQVLTNFLLNPYAKIIFEEVENNGLNLASNWDEINPGNNRFHIGFTTKNARMVLQLDKYAIVPRKDNIDIVQGDPSKNDLLQQLYDYFSEAYRGAYDDSALAMDILLYLSFQKDRTFFGGASYITFTTHSTSCKLSIAHFGMAYWLSEDAYWAFDFEGFVSRPQIERMFLYTDIIRNISHGEVQ